MLMYTSILSVLRQKTILRIATVQPCAHQIVRSYVANSNQNKGVYSGKGDHDRGWTETVNSYISESNASRKSPEQLWLEKSKAAFDELSRVPPANPYSGRSVEVTDGNVANAYKQLDNILSRNKVRIQLRLAERHEKRGVKRRRLSSERWRKQFANEVRKKVQLVQQIRDRGA